MMPQLTAGLIDSSEEMRKRTSITVHRGHGRIIQFCEPTSASAKNVTVAVIPTDESSENDYQVVEPCFAFAVERSGRRIVLDQYKRKCSPELCIAVQKEVFTRTLYSNTKGSVHQELCTAATKGSVHQTLYSIQKEVFTRTLYSNTKGSVHQNFVQQYKRKCSPGLCTAIQKYVFTRTLYSITKGSIHY
ncbi:hypothetical protein HNY73_011904 [Argiope bruennichi]|uniref:Uncharacterized protein n=1 Tax=Argiope bruennichi TaxID=94029 RepID=A0A8T0ETA6_ARGBR|nr:hypothetical protein HNY73_011904 [Argiope bruennichi]